MNNLRNIAVIANPASQNGNGAALASLMYDSLSQVAQADDFTMHLTNHSRHAMALAEQIGPTCDTLIVVGGDGIIHEAVNGLMRLPQESRPTLGVIPTGSGNDYAQSLGMSTKPQEAISQLQRGSIIQADIGLCNGEYYTETLSFGLDAAIALDTIERRKVTGHRGTRLYLESGIDQLFHHLDTHHYRLEYEDPSGTKRTASGSSHIFAVQNGQTYGGGFKVCPKAKLDDGLFDICIAHAPLSVAKATAIFLLAKEGKHTGFKQIESFQARSLTVDFEQEPATQIDGEPFMNTHFEISMAPHALSVITA